MRNMTYMLVDKNIHDVTKSFNSKLFEKLISF